MKAEKIADTCRIFEGANNREAIESMYRRQTPPDTLRAALRRASAWPWCRGPDARSEGVQYALLLEFLINDEVRNAKSL